MILNKNCDINISCNRLYLDFKDKEGFELYTIPILIKSQGILNMSEQKFKLIDSVQPRVNYTSIKDYYNSKHK